MTIVAGFNPLRSGTAPLNLAAQLARTTGEPLVAVAVVERPWPPRADPTVEADFLRIVTSRATASLADSANRVRIDLDLDVECLVHAASSVPAGMLEIAECRDASAVVVGSSSSGLFGRISLGSVTERLVHTAKVPVLLAPRQYPQLQDKLSRLTIGYGGNAAAAEFLETSAKLATAWHAGMRVATFTMRPISRYSGSIEPAADDLVIQQWHEATRRQLTKQLGEVRRQITLPNVELATGIGYDWRQAVENIPWVTGDVLVLGSGAAGQVRQVFLGSAASKILRHAPVPVMILPLHYSP